MNRKHIILIILVATTIIILTFFTFNKHIVKSVKKENNVEYSDVTESKVMTNNEINKSRKSVYDTNQYQSYKQFTRFIYEFPPEILEYIGEITVDGIKYNQYGDEDIKIEVISMDSYSENHMQGLVDYTVFFRDRTFSFKEKITPSSESLTIYYVDINKDNTKDIVLKGEPFSGTSINYYWMRTIDLIYMDEIEVFQKEGYVRLTSEQKETLDNMLKEDTKFNEVFPDYEWLGNYANTLIDCFGNIYYEIGLGKEITYDIGNILLLFDYNKITHKYNLVDYDYMPRYVLE